MPAFGGKVDMEFCTAHVRFCSAPKLKKHARWPEADIFTANLPKFARMVVARHRAEGPFKGGGVRYHTNGERHVR